MLTAVCHAAQVFLLALLAKPRLVTHALATARIAGPMPAALNAVALVEVLTLLARPATLAHAHA